MISNITRTSLQPSLRACISAFYEEKGHIIIIYYISDLNFGYKNAITFDNCSFESVEEMDKKLISNWNLIVREEDHVYIVGDFAFHNTKPAEWYLAQLAGHKHLIIGNHDMKTLKNESAMLYFESVSQMTVIKDRNQQVCLCHYPIADWYGARQGSVLVYGHIHASTGEAYQFMKTQPKALNAAACINHYMPASLETLLEHNTQFQKGRQGADLTAMQSLEPPSELLWATLATGYNEDQQPSVFDHIPLGILSSLALYADRITYDRDDYISQPDLLFTFEEDDFAQLKQVFAEAKPIIARILEVAKKAPLRRCAASAY